MRRIKQRRPRQSVLFRYLGSYLSIALFALTVAAGIGILLFSGQMQREEQEHVFNKLEMAAASLDAHLGSINDMAGEITIHREYMRQYFTQNYETEQDMMRLLRNYEGMLPFPYTYYLDYHSLDSVYTGRAKYSEHVFFNYLLESKEATLLRAMTAEGSYLDADTGLLVYRIPIAILSTKFDLIVIVPCDNMCQYLARVMGVPKEAVSLSFGDRLVFGDGGGTFAQTLENGLSLVLREEIPRKTTSETMARYILVLAVLALIVIATAVVISYRNYTPIKRISRSYIGETVDGDELSQIEYALDSAITAYRTSQKRMGEMSLLIEDQRRVLHRQYLRRILHEGVNGDSTLEVFEAVGIHLVGPFTLIASLTLRPNDDIEKIEINVNQLSTENDMVFYAVQEEQQIYILINALDRSTLFSGMNMLSALFEDGREMVFSDIASSYEAIGTLVDSIAKESTRSSVIRMEIEEVREAILASQMEEALANLYEMEKNIQGNENIYIKEGARTEFARELFDLSAEEDKPWLRTRITAPLLASDSKEYLHVMTEVIRTICENRRKAHAGERKGAQLIEYIEQHYGEYGMSLDTLADAFGMSTWQVRGEIKAETGESYMEYLKKVRIRKATEKLMETDMSVAEIGEAVGYSNISYFIRLFREHTGYTPSVWRSIGRSG